MQFVVQTRIMWFFIFITLLLLGVAVLLELLRRRRERWEGLLKEWEMVKSIMRERELASDEIELLTTILKKYKPENLSAVITLRQHFNRCIMQYITEQSRRMGIFELDRLGNQLRDIRIHLGLDYIPYGQRIYGTMELYKNQTLWFTPTTEDPKLWRKGTVVDVNEAFFRVSPFTPQDELRRSYIGQYVIFKMWREDDARYQFKAVLAEIEDEPITYVFHHTHQLERLQSRAYLRVRIDKTIEVDVVAISSAYDVQNISVEDIPYTKLLTLRARLVNLSAGGCAMMIDRDIDDSLYIRFSLNLTDIEESNPVILLMRIIGKVNIALGRYLYRGEFVGISEETRERLAKFVFRQQPPVAKALQRQSSQHELDHHE